MNNEYYDRIARFLNNEMGSDERLAFEEELMNNHLLKEDVDFEKSLIENGASLQNKFNELDGSNPDSNKEEVFKLIKKARANWEEKNANSNSATNTPSSFSDSTSSHALSSRNKLSWRRFSIAAAVIGVIGLVAIVYIINNNRKLVSNTNKTQIDSSTTFIAKDSSRQPAQVEDQNITKLNDTARRSTASNKEPISNSETRDDLFAKYFSPETESASAPDVLQEPISLYESKKYDEALAAFQHIDPALATRGDAEEQDLTLFYTYYYKALCLISKNNFTMAIDDLQVALSKSKQADLTSKTQWYLALAYLKTGEIKKANSYLDLIISNRHVDSNQEKATSLKKEISTR